MKNYFTTQNITLLRKPLLHERTFFQKKLNLLKFRLVIYAFVSHVVDIFPTRALDRISVKSGIRYPKQASQLKG